MRSRICRQVLAVALLGACSQDPTLVNPSTFERPGDVAFVCYDTETRAYVALDMCGDEDRYAMTALVTQTASGEVGAVDLRLNRTLDADVRVPGFTFVRVGEVPSGIVVPPDEPGVTYIANFGSRSVQWMDTARFRPDVDTGSGVEQGSIALPDGPTSMVLSPEGDAVFVTLPRMGAVLPIPILPSRILEQPAEGDLVTLSAVMPDMLPLAPATNYRRTCNLQGTLRQPSAEVHAPVSLGMAPEPESLLVVDDQLLVADAALPVIHRFTIGAGGALTPLDPIATGTPVERLAVSPIVPETTDQASDMTRYLYAIDAADQSVMVIDFMEGSPNFGALVPVQTGDGPADRLQLSADALSLGVLTPGYPGTSCTTPDTGVRPTELRGVFLAVGLTNGAFVLFDVVDLDAPCRGGIDCTEPATTADVLVAIERHRPRVGEFVRTGMTLTATPSFSFLGSPGQLNPSGEPADPSEPGLSVLDGCPDTMTEIYGETGEPVICAQADPWASRDERWRATYEGVRIGTPGGRGRFDGDVMHVEAGDASFCTRGVLGTEDVVASGLSETDPEAGYGGDLFVITSNPPQSRVAAMSGCEKFVDPEDGSDFVTPRFRIVRAEQQALEVSFEDDPASAQSTNAAEVFACYQGAFFEYEVRVRQAFLVTGSRTEPIHRVIDDGGCRVDVAGQPIVMGDPQTYRTDLARDGRLFVNPAVAFSIDLRDRTIDDRGARLSFALGTTPATLAVDVGARGAAARRPALVEELLYNDVNERLYALDSNSDGFIEYSLSPLQTENIFE